MVTLVFDVMDTLVVDPFHDALPAFFGLDLDAFLSQKHPTLWMDFETARVSEADYLARLFLDRRPVDGPALRRHLAASYRWVDGMEELLRELVHSGHELHAMSNYPVWYHLIEEELGLSRYLQWSFVSWDTGVRKPDRRAFLRAASRLGTPASQLVLVDDQAPNVTAAREQGWRAAQFTSAPALREQLEALGLNR